jgi:hypothetical protein
MPRTQASIEKIRAELAWVNETPDPNKCGRRKSMLCRNSPQAGSMYELNP